MSLLVKKISVRSADILDFDPKNALGAKLLTVIDTIPT